MKILIRTDASHKIGTGHVMRCLTLAKALRKRAADCRFICRGHEGNLIERIQQEGFETLVLPNVDVIDSSNEAKQPTLAHAEWLGADCQTDAQHTIDALANESFDWLIVDHYALDIRWETIMRSSAKKIMVIDDLADREHDCDLLLDQNLFLDLETRYNTLVPTRCVQLRGPTFALLQPEYSSLYLRTPPRVGPVKRILVFFGGAEQRNLNELALSAFLAIKRDDIILDIVISSNCPQAGKVRAQALGHTNIILHDTLPSLATLMLRADLAIGAGGATSWERCCLGLPTLVISLAENQRPIAKSLDQQGLAIWIGHYDEVTEQMLTKALQEIILNPNLEKWSNDCTKVVDGRGVERVVSILTLNVNTPIQVRDAHLSDERLAVRWEKERMVYKGQPNLVENADEVYRRIFYERLRNPEYSKIYIGETKEGVPIGQVRFEHCKDGWTIYLALAEEARGKNICERVLHAAMLEFRRSETSELIFTRVNCENQTLPNSIVDTAIADRIDAKRLLIAVCSDINSWINEYIPEILLQWLLLGHQCIWTHDAKNLSEGDICFYLSFSKIVGKEARSKYRNNLVVHESDLPSGKGWSPLTWQVLEGKSCIPVTLLEAEDSVDSGSVYAQKWITLEGHELIDEIRRKQATATNEICQWFVDEYPKTAEKGRAQQGTESYYNRRRPNDSELNHNKSLTEQFNLFRVVDNDRYPAYFIYKNHKYIVRISRAVPGER